MWPELWKRCSKSEKEKIIKDEEAKTAAEQAGTSSEVACTDVVPDDNAKQVDSMVAAGSQPVGRSQNSSHATTQRKTVSHYTSKEVNDVLDQGCTHGTDQKCDIGMQNEALFP